MNVVLTIIAIIVIFSVVVLIHEYGHFIAARRNRIQIKEFGVGFPPRLYGKKINGILYSINAIPFGGFVRLLGEDAADPEMLKNKKSYASKSPWIRTKVIVAGVLMNFLLAIVLLTIGFSFGIEPLLVTEQDLFNHLAAGNIETAPGIYVAKISGDARQSGINPGDQIIAINDRSITEAGQLAVFVKGEAVRDIDITIREAADPATVQKIHLPLTGNDNYFGIDLKPATEFPRLAILEVRRGSESKRAGLKPQDVILKMNDKEIYFPEDFESALIGSANITFTILRGNEILQIPVKFPDTNRVVVADVFSSSAAQAAGFQKGDIIISIDGNIVTRPEDVQEILKNNPAKKMLYRVYRSGRDIQITASTGANNLLGIALSSASSFRNAELSFYRTNLLTSITKIKKVRYGPLQSFRQSISESARLIDLTIQAFGRTIKSIVSKFTVPAEIGGPVQIAYYTHTFVKEGFFALLRFTAILSLSLGVINILPIPALDGGRFLFIIIEILFKKRVNARVESMVHAIGFVLLIGLIFLVTYSDIVKLF